MENKRDFKFDKRAESYDEGFEGKSSQKFYDLVTGNVEITAGMNVLDAGCGTGTILRRLSEKYSFHGFGIDVEEKMLEQARKKCPDMDIRLCSCDDTPFEDGQFDVIIACMGLENNCTRSISEKSTYQIVTIKGLCSGAGSFIIALVIGEKLPNMKYILPVLLLGFVAYGLSIFTYIRAQKTLGAAKTSAYYAVAPFIGSFLSFVLLKEMLTLVYIVALVVMIGGTALVVADNHQTE